MVERVLNELDRPHVKNWGYVIFACLLSFAAGNALQTRSALDGEAHWWQGYCHQQVVTHVQLQKNLDNQ
jgi:hypothetical protein